jgi:hypothetical protein
MTRHFDFPSSFIVDPTGRWTGFSGLPFGEYYPTLAAKDGVPPKTV